MNCPQMIQTFERSEWRPHLVEMEQHRVPLVFQSILRDLRFELLECCPSVVSLYPSPVWKRAHGYPRKVLARVLTVAHRVKVQRVNTRIQSLLIISLAMRGDTTSPRVHLCEHLRSSLAIR